MSVTGDLAKGKLLGHPIHMMLLHFPAALLPSAAGYDALQQFTSFHVGADSIYLLWPGVVLGWLAALFGFWDLTRLPQASDKLQTALIHGGINGLSLLCFSWVLWMRVSDPVSLTLAIAEIVGTLIMLIGNKYGGDLVLRHRVAVHEPGDLE